MSSNGKERERLSEKSNEKIFPWNKWGPYVSERSWGTVREDYSKNGDAWEYFNHNMAVSKTYRWGEDGICGFCDRFQVAALSFAFWNGKDTILKERLFGVSSTEGNHSEDVKEYYYYLDATPSHSYMKFLYKYPQEKFPYEKLIQENGNRSTKEEEFELVDTGVFNDGKYFDIFIEYAKNTPEDICVKVEIINRAKESAKLHILPQIVLRREFTKHAKKLRGAFIKAGEEGCLELDDSEAEDIDLVPFEYSLGKRFFYGEKPTESLFTCNESNNKKLIGKENDSIFVKDAFHRHIVNKEQGVVNPEKLGSKAALHYADIEIGAGESRVLCFRFSDKELSKPLSDVEEIVKVRKQEADEFYNDIHTESQSEEEKMIQRQALAGMIWSKQFYYYDVDRWLKGDDLDHPISSDREEIRNKHWKHLVSMRILSMPDKWEYPWFAAWDLAFHTIPFALIDINFAKEQLWLLLFDQFQHPNGQIPAYEWEFSEMNPPVQGWAVLRVFQMEQSRTGNKDYDFLKKCFHKLVINFVWWVNKVDSKGNNVFEGGFLGLDNITIIDRSSAIPGGGTLEQSDGTGWMGMFCLILMRIALTLAEEDKSYENLAVKFFEHYVYIAAALHMSATRDVQIWNETDGFFYDVISYPNKSHEQILVRSLVGIIPLYAIDTIDEDELEKFPEFKQSFTWFLKHREGLVSKCVTYFPERKKYLLALMTPHQIEKVLDRVWDPEEFKSTYGLRSLSKHYEKHPYVLLGKSITYEPGEAIDILKGGNSNWRGPIWFPTTFLFLDSLKKLYAEFGEDIYIERDGRKVYLDEIATYFAKALVSVFKKGEDGKRPVYGDCEIMQKDPHFRDYILFYEHFHGDTGRGLGASHQTGWTGLVANLIDEWLR